MLPPSLGATLIAAARVPVSARSRSVSAEHLVDMHQPLAEMQLALVGSFELATEHSVKIALFVEAEFAAAPSGTGIGRTLERVLVARCQGGLTAREAGSKHGRVAQFCPGLITAHALPMGVRAIGIGIPVARQRRAAESRVLAEPVIMVALSRHCFLLVTAPVAPLATAAKTVLQLRIMHATLRESNQSSTMSASSSRSNQSPGTGYSIRSSSASLRRAMSTAARSNGKSPLWRPSSSTS